MNAERVAEGDDVLLRGSDGLIYLGVAVELDEGRRDGKAILVRFGDGTEIWGRRLDIRLLGGGGGFAEDRPSIVNGAAKSKTGVLKRNFPQTAGSKPLPLPASHVIQARKELPYDFDSLLWDENHLRNDKERYCYCGESGDWYKKMLQCDQCQQWFHQDCIRSNQVPSLLLGDRYYEFSCTLCTGTSVEVIRRKKLNWVDAIHLTLFNLTIANNNKYHDVTTSVIPFIRKKWKELQGPSGWLKSSRLEPEFVVGQLNANKSRFRCGSSLKNRTNYWALRKIAPPSCGAKTNINGFFSNGIKPLVLSDCKAVKNDVGRRPAIKNPSNSSRSNGATSGSRMGASMNGKGLVLFHCNAAAEGRSKRPRLSVDGRDGDRSTAFRSGTLDRLIPPPKNFAGSNNPFWEHLGPPVLVPQIHFPTCKVGNASCRDCSGRGQRQGLSSSFRRRRKLSSRDIMNASCSKCSSKEGSGFTTSPDREVDSSSNSVSSVDGCNPPPLLDCSAPASPGQSAANRLPEMEMPPTLDIFQLHPVDSQSCANGGESDAKPDLNSHEAKTAQPVHLSARRLTQDGDIQYLLQKDCDGPWTDAVPVICRPSTHTPKPHSESLLFQLADCPHLPK